MTDDLVKRLRDLNFGFEYDGPDGLSALIAKYDHLMCLAAESASALESLSAENVALRKIISECASALPNGAIVGPEASLDFMKMLPGEISAVCATLLQQRNEAFERAASEAKAVRRQYVNGDAMSPYGKGYQKACDDIAERLRNLSKES